MGDVQKYFAADVETSGVITLRVCDAASCGDVTVTVPVPLARIPTCITVTPGGPGPERVARRPGGRRPVDGGRRHRPAPAVHQRQLAPIDVAHEERRPGIEVVEAGSPSRFRLTCCLPTAMLRPPDLQGAHRGGDAARGADGDADLGVVRREHHRRRLPPADVDGAMVQTWPPTSTRNSLPPAVAVT